MKIVVEGIGAVTGDGMDRRKEEEEDDLVSAKVTVQPAPGAGSGEARP